MTNPKTIKEITDNLVRDLCSVEFRGKNKTRVLIENYQCLLLDEVEKRLPDNRLRPISEITQHINLGAIEYKNQVISLLSDMREGK